jgi:hypothetical protein
MPGWKGPEDYGLYIGKSEKAIDKNIENAENLDLNTSLATLISAHREQHHRDYDVISPRAESGKLVKTAKRIEELIKTI